MTQKNNAFDNLPPAASEYIRLVIKNMGYRKKAREEVRLELIDHFTEHLKDCTENKERENKAQQLINDFGDPKLLAVLMRRAKKRCRPLWQKFLVKTAAALGLVFVYLLICFARLQIGSPTIKINYAQWLTEQARQGRDESLNANLQLEKAAALLSKDDFYPDFNWPADINNARRIEIADFLKANADALDMLSNALSKPYYWVDYNSAVPDVNENNFIFSQDIFILSSRMPFLADYRKLSYLLSMRTLSEAYQSNLEKAIQDLGLLFKFGLCLEGKGLLIEQLTGSAIEGIAHKTSINILSHSQLSARHLKLLQETLETDFNAQKQIYNLTVEKMLWYDHVQRSFTDDGKGNGRVLKAGIPLIVTGWKDALWRFSTFSYPDRAEFLSDINSYFEETQRSYEIPPWQLAPRLYDMNLLFIPAPNYILLKIVDPVYENLRLHAWRLKTQRQALLTILATLRFEKQTGRYPENLDELVQNGSLTQLPLDPFSGGPLTYKKTKEGFLLYSWGSNLKDDDGVPSRNEKGKIKMFADEGDWLFWPVEKD